VQQVQVDGLNGKTTLVVEAIDGLCPFPGAFGARHHEIGCENDGRPMSTASYQGQSVRWETCPKTFPIRTESEIRKDYGSLIINGQGAAPKPPAGESPYKNVALPAPDRPLKCWDAPDRGRPRRPTRGRMAFARLTSSESFLQRTTRRARNHDVALVPRGFRSRPQLCRLEAALQLSGRQAILPSNSTLRSVMPDIGQGIMASNVLNRGVRGPTRRTNACT
jgi:hypothetical protein